MMKVSARPNSLIRLLPGMLLLAALLWLMRDTASSMVSIWIRSETFTHAFLVPPIVLWLVWRKRDVLAATPTRPVPWLLLPIAAACFGWLLGELVSVGVAAQFALVSVIVLCVPALFGWAVARELTFPLLFLYFAVPVGEFTVPQLMAWTADFTVLALRATGVPVYREGLQFIIPSGNWSVVDACSGVRYLIASFMVGTLFAYLNYRSIRRRLIFIALSLLVPILANWVRAYMIVMIGHLSDNQLAVGVDHLIYGWVFFGVVIGLMYFIGARWPEAGDDLERSATPVATEHRSAWAMAAGIVVLVVATQAWTERLEHATSSSPQLVLEPLSGAETAAVVALPWRPGFPNPNVTAELTQDVEGRRFWIWIGYYRQQGDERKLVSSVNGLVGADDKGWVQVSAGDRPEDPPLPAFRTGVLRNGQGLATATGARLRVWQVYWVGGRWTTSDVLAKVWQAADRLSGHGDDGAVVLMATAMDDEADAALETFARVRLGSIAKALAGARDTP